MKHTLNNIDHTKRQESTVLIQPIKNGFVLQRNCQQKVIPDYRGPTPAPVAYSSSDDHYVFETFGSLVEFLKKEYNPEQKITFSGVRYEEMGDKPL